MSPLGARPCIRPGGSHFFSQDCQADVETRKTLPIRYITGASTPDCCALLLQSTLPPMNEQQENRAHQSRRREEVPHSYRTGQVSDINCQDDGDHANSAYHI